nr:hypothetical protein [Anaerolineae bacterium]
MPIRLAPIHETTQVQIDPKFLDLLQTCLLRHRENLEEKLRTKRLHYQNTDAASFRRAAMAEEIKHLQVQLAQLQDAGTGTAARRGGFDYQVTRLKRLPYKMLTVKHHRGIDWMVAQTDSFVTVHEQGYYAGTYDHGPYYVCVNTSSFGTLSPSVHVLPAQDPRERYRHMHQTAQIPEENANPLDYLASTCWGGFAGIIPALFEDADVASLFDYLHKYVGNINPADALCHPPYTSRREGAL